MGKFKNHQARPKVVPEVRQKIRPADEEAMPGKKILSEKTALSAILICLAAFCISIIIFPQLRFILLEFVERHSPRVPTAEEKDLLATLIFTLPIAGFILSGLFVCILLFENAVFGFLKNNIVIIGYSGISLIALLVRLSGFQFASVDYSAFIHPWIEYLSQNGHFFWYCNHKF